MLEFMRIQRFKTLLDASFPLSGLNLFSGLNGLGKSSLIQTLLLLRQSYERNTLLTRGLLLKGDYVSIGTGQDALSEQAHETTFDFLLKWEGSKPVRFLFDYSAQSDLQPLAGAIAIEGIESISLFNRNFQYLAADRISPRSSYDVSNYHIQDLNSLGNHGEYTAHYIAENGLAPIPIKAMRHAKAASANLLENLDKWMAELSPGLRIHAVLQPQLNAVALSYAFEQGKQVTADYKPQNVGFGLTYVLPIVTALLRAKAGDLLIMENPESHLHPAGQAVVGRLCAIAAANGVQLVIETHSDHFLNGVRVAVKDGILGADSVALFFLERDAEGPEHASLVRSPSIDSEGRIDQWPEGFFDEWDRQLGRLL